MPNPVASDVHVSVPLTNISIAYMQAATGFVADRVFPNIPVSKQANRYTRYDRSDFWRNQFQKRAPSTESAGGGWKIDNTANYFADVWALHKDIDDDTRANQDEQIDMDRDATIWLTQQALISREVTWAANNFTTGIWGTDITGAASAPSASQVLQWNDAASDPIVDITKKSDVVHLASGIRPNKLVLGRQVWSVLKDHSDTLDRVKYTGGNNTPAIVTRQAFASMCELDSIEVMDGIQVTSPENPSYETSMTTAWIAGKNALLVYANPTPSLLTPSGGYTFSWTGRVAASQQGTRISRLRIDQIKSDRVEGEMAYDQKVIAKDCGLFFGSVIA
jgi:hypothetical protein